MRLVAFVATGALLLGLASVTLASDPIYATVDGYLAGTPSNNHADTFGDDCFKLDDGQGTSFVLDANYGMVIVKAGSEASAPGHVNTVFADAAAGETVWADTNGDGVYNPGGPGGDKGISHIVFCGAGNGESPSASASQSASQSQSASPSASMSESESQSASPSASMSESESQSASPSASMSESESPSASVSESESPTPEQSVSASASASESESQSPEQSVEGGTGTPEASQPDTAMSAGTGSDSSPIPTVLFALILVAALGTLTWANVKTARSRA